MPFKPKANAHVSQIRAAVQYSGSGVNQVNLSLYSDVSGAPGVLLAGPVTVKNLPTFFTCCELATANIPSTAVTAGTQYWVVADTPSTGTGSDFYGVWAFVPPSKSLVGADLGGGWLVLVRGRHPRARRRGLRDDPIAFCTQGWLDEGLSSQPPVVGVPARGAVPNSRY